MAQSTQKDSNAELEAVKADLAQLRGDVSDLLQVVREQGEERVRDRATQARDDVQSAFEEGMDTLKALTGTKGMPFSPPASITRPLMTPLPGSVLIISK